MKRKPNNDKCRGGHMTRIVFMGATLVMAGSVAAFGQGTNTPARTDYSYFQIIAERNIFNPDRYSHEARSRRERREAPADAFALVGTMSYQKGDFAFFDGTSETYRKVLELDGTIAGYKVTAITPDTVTLQATNKQVELTVGSQMRREGTNWQLVAKNDLPMEVTDNPETSTAASDAGGDSGGEVSDVLKRLMQRREQELK